MVGEDQQHQREDDHAQDLGRHADVVEQGQQPDAERVDEVDTSRARIDRNDHMFRKPIGLGGEEVDPDHSDDMTYGTVAATAVTVRTPAQK